MRRWRCDGHFSISSMVEFQPQWLTGPGEADTEASAFGSLVTLPAARYLLVPVRRRRLTATTSTIWSLLPSSAPGPPSSLRRDLFCAPLSSPFPGRHPRPVPCAAVVATDPSGFDLEQLISLPGTIVGELGCSLGQTARKLRAVSYPLGKKTGPVYFSRVAPQPVYRGS
jgi:hypothetical protein